MDERITKEHKFECKYYLNGFPKSGLHILNLMLTPISNPIKLEGAFVLPWAGTFDDHSWTNKWLPIEQFCYKIGRLSAGEYVKGHCGYSDGINEFMYLLGLAHVFVYRDLRDVVVSQAHHILHDDDVTHAHPAKDLYRELGSFENVLRAVIKGHDRFPGVIKRWEQYAPWIREKWVLKVRYEDLRTDPHKEAMRILSYGMNRVSVLWGYKTRYNPPVVDTVVDTMVKASEQTDCSTSFRKGGVGDWEEVFTPELMDCFKRVDRSHWLVQLGYEEEEDW